MPNRNRYNIGGPAVVGRLPGLAAQHPVGGDHVEEMVMCCVPTGCPAFHDSPIVLSDPSDAVRVLCNNESCDQGGWMHYECFMNWEEHVLNYLRSCGRARSWSEKQRLQNLWTKKGYDLAFKVCDCKCGKGHLRKDLNVVAINSKSDVQQDKKRRRHKSKPQSASPPLERGHGPLTMNIHAMKAQQQQILMQMQHHMQQQQQLQQHQQQHQQHNRPQLRVRTSSFSSTGSVSPPSSAGTPPLTPGSGSSASSGSSGSSGKSNKLSSKFDFFANNNRRRPATFSAAAPTIPCSTCCHATSRTPITSRWKTRAPTATMRPAASC